jgi:Na+/melibiose symporter-like transporter
MSGWQFKAQQLCKLSSTSLPEPMLKDTSSSPRKRQFNFTMLLLAVSMINLSICSFSSQKMNSEMKSRRK